MTILFDQDYIEIFCHGNEIDPVAWLKDIKVMMRQMPFVMLVSDIFVDGKYLAISDHLAIDYLPVSDLWDHVFV